MDAWLGNRKRILVLNREDMISSADRNAWATYFTGQGIKLVFSNGQLGMVSKLVNFFSDDPDLDVVLVDNALMW